jgi:nucleoside-diphosphate-sugar epimerase
LQGVTNLVSAAAREHVPHFVLISSAYVTRPFSFVYILLNSLAGRVMHWKLLVS